MTRASNALTSPNQGGADQKSETPQRLGVDRAVGVVHLDDVLTAVLGRRQHVDPAVAALGHGEELPGAPDVVRPIADWREPERHSGHVDETAALGQGTRRRTSSPRR